MQDPTRRMDYSSLPSYRAGDPTDRPDPDHRRWVLSFGFLVVIVVVFAAGVMFGSCLALLWLLGPIAPID
jgi:hypothetical protein